MIKYFFILALLLLSIPSYSAPSCSKNGTDIIYTNGILTSEAKAQEALYKIEDLNLNDKIDSKDVLYILAYNYSQNFAHDFLETIVQRMPRSFLKENGYKDGYAAYMNFLSGNIGNLFSKVVLDDIFSNIQEIEAQLVQHQNSVTNVLAFYEAAFADKRRILGISHSQGGLFLNDAYSEFIHEDKEKYFAGLEIATPALFLTPHLSDHATHDRDQVINFVRSSIGALAPNIDAGLIVGNTFNELGDWTDFVLNHGIVTTYLADAELKAAVTAKIISTAEKLKSNCGVPPVANFTYFKNPTDSMNYNFNASSSYDLDEQDPQSTNPIPEPPDFDILSFNWVVDGVTVASVSLPNYSHDFQTEGPHTVKLVVIDREGNSDESDEQTINVFNTGPIADFSATPQALHFSFDGSLSTDSNNQIVSYEWSFGDGNFAIGMTPSHSYLLEGHYAVSLKVTNNKGDSNTVTKLVLASNAIILKVILNGGFPSFSYEWNTGATTSIIQVSISNPPPAGYKACVQDAISRAQDTKLCKIASICSPVSNTEFVEGASLDFGIDCKSESKITDLLF